MTYGEYKLIKRIMKHAGQPEGYYEKRYRATPDIKKALSNGYIDHQVTGYESYKSDFIIGAYPVHSDVLVVTKAGETEFDKYAEHRREMLSGRKFSVWMAIIGAVLSLVISVVVNLLFQKPPAP